MRRFAHHARTATYSVGVLVALSACGDADPMTAAELRGLAGPSLEGTIVDRYGDVRLEPSEVASVFVDRPSTGLTAFVVGGVPVVALEDLTEDGSDWATSAARLESEFWGISPNGPSTTDCDACEGSIRERTRELLKAKIEARLSPTIKAKLRIEAVTTSAGGIGRYAVRGKVSGTAWAPLCGGEPAYLLPGTWNDATADLPTAPWAPGDSVAFACPGSSAAKCIELGYRPWSADPTEARLHQACVRMLRADYCGDGISHTEEGVVIAFRDALALHDDGSRRLLEATWTEHGAACIERTRLDLEGLPQCVRNLERERCQTEGALLVTALPELESTASGALQALPRGLNVALD